MLKVSADHSMPDGEKVGADHGVVSHSVFEFPLGAAQQHYTGGIDAHFAANWRIHDNTFRNIRSPEKRLAEHAIHFWRGSSDTIVERNMIFNADRGIGFGQGMPSLQLGVSSQYAMLRSLLIVRNRVDCPEWLTILSRHPAAGELRTASQQALRNVANILDGKPEESVDLHAVIERVRPIVLQEAKDALIRDRSAIETHLGFFEELISALKPMPQQARETRLKFA